MPDGVEQVGWEPARLHKVTRLEGKRRLAGSLRRHTTARLHGWKVKRLRGWEPTLLHGYTAARLEGEGKQPNNHEVTSISFAHLHVCCTIPPQFGVDSISPGSPHVRCTPMLALSTCAEPDETKINTHPKHITAFVRDRHPPWGALPYVYPSQRNQGNRAHTVDTSGLGLGLRMHTVIVSKTGLIRAPGAAPDRAAWRGPQHAGLYQEYQDRKVMPQN